METKVPRVGIYNRCSTEEEAQVNALAIQAEESREIAQKKGWTITAQYIESESGTSIKRRLEYQQLLKDMETDLFDIVMIKSIDRLMRSAKDWYMFINLLTINEKKLYIYIEDNYYTPENSLITGIKAILAEEFSRELSKKIKNAHERRQNKKSGFNITRPMFGWNKIGINEYEINEEEAKAYRTAFILAEQGKGFYSIAKEFEAQGIRSKNGNMISSVQWRKMLYSPRAHGTVVLHRNSYDFETKKRVKVPEEEWIYIDNALPPIVSKEYHEKVIRIMQEKSTKNIKDYARDMSNRGKYLLSGKVYCSECNSKYYRASISYKEGIKKVAWKCSKALSEGRKINTPNGCDNIIVYEEELLELIEETCKNQYDVIFGVQQNIIEEALSTIRKALKDNSLNIEIEKATKERESLNHRKKVLFDKLMNEVIEDEEFKMYNASLTEQLKNVEDKIKELSEKSNNCYNIEERLIKIRESLNENDVIDKAKTKEFIMRISRIIVYPDGRIDINFDRNKLLGLLKLYNISDFNLEEKYFNISTNYRHKTVYEIQREEINKKILITFRNNPDLCLKDVCKRLGMSESYINTSVKQLKSDEKLHYKRNGNTHTGKWIVTDNI